MNNTDVYKHLKSFLFWFGLLLISMSFFSFSGFYEYPPNLVTGMLFLVPGVLMMIYTMSTTAINLKLWVKVLLIIATIPTILFYSFPANIGCVILLIYLLLSLTKVKYCDKFLSPTIVVIIQGLVFQFVWWVFPNLHETKHLHKLYYFLLKILGAEVSLFDGSLVLRSGDSLVRYLVTYEQLAIPLVLVFLCGSIIAVIMNQPKDLSKKIIRLFAGCLVYVLLRYGVLIILYPLYHLTALFWRALPTMFSFLPLVLILTFLLPQKSLSLIIEMPSKRIYHGLVVGLCLFLFLLPFTITDPGVKKEGKIFIDEYHGKDWEPVTVPLDRQNFGGQRSVYTYYSLVEWIKNFYPVEVVFSPEEYDNLHNYDILVLKTPTREFSQDVIEKIVSFVEGGGGLFVIGDHTNVFGMNGYLNSIVKRWGIEFLYDSTFDLRTTGLTKYSPPTLFPHPIVQDFNQYKFATSCTLKTDIFTDNIIVGYGMGAEGMDLATINFFGNLYATPEDRWGLFVQTAAKRVGKGRVLAFSDSTTFSSFSVFMHDNPIFLAGIFNYLNKSNTTAWFVLQICAALLLFGLLIWGILRRHHFLKLDFLITLALVVPVSFSFANLTSRYVNHRNYLEEVHVLLNEDPAIHFYLGHSEGINVPPAIGVSPDENDFSSLFIALQRLGFSTRESRTFKECFKGSPKGIIVINPNKLFTSKEKETIRNFVNEGGTFIICDSPFHSKSTSSNLTQLFDIVSYKSSNQLPLATGEGIKTKTAIVPSWRLYPGQESPALDFKQSEKIVNLYYFKKDIGEGQVVFIGDSFILSNLILGDPGNPPTAFQFELYQEIFNLLEFLKD